MKVTIDLNAPLYEFYKSGIIQALYRKGNPNAMLFRYYECFLARKDEGHNRTKSAALAADDCGVTIVTIWKAIKVIERNGK